MHRLLVIISYFLVLLTLLFDFSILAQEDKGIARNNKKRTFSIKSFVSKDKIYIGDKINYTIQITFHRSLRVIKPGPGADFAPFEIKHYEILKPKFNGDIVTDTIIYTLSIYEVGEFSLPQSSAKAIIEQKEIELKTSDIKISVMSANAGDKRSEEIYDIKSPMTPSGSVPTRYYFYLFSPVYLGLFYLLFLWLRKKYRKNFLPAPYELALESLNELYSRNFIRDGFFSEFYFQFSMIVRRYLERTTYIPSTTSTTTQILMIFKNKNIEHSDFYKDLFVYADAIKFAKQTPDPIKTGNYKKRISEILFADKQKNEEEMKRKKDSKKN